MKNVFISFRAEEKLRDRLKALADREHRTLSQMAIVLLGEALNERECREQIRRAERKTPDETIAKLNRRVERKNQEFID